MEPTDTHDDPTPETLDAGAPEGDAPDGGTAGRPAHPEPTRQPQLGVQALLTKKTDFAARPGFRNPANARSKASKKGRKK